MPQEDDNVYHEISQRGLRIQRLEDINADLLAALEDAQNTLASLACLAGDVPEWNEGGFAFETCQTIRTAIAKAKP